MRATELRMYDGETNSDSERRNVFECALVIRDAGALQRVRVDLVIDYESHVTEAKQLILDALERTDGVVDDPAPSVFLMTLAVEGINLSMYYWVNTEENGIFEMTDKVSMEVNKSLQRCRNQTCSRRGRCGLRMFQVESLRIKTVTRIL